jgi:hypothetical protein
MRLVGGLAVLCATILAFASAPAYAETVSVTIGVGDTILTVSGQSSPGAFVTISKDGGVIGTMAADGSGVFSQTFPAQEPGIHEISVFAHTSGGHNTDTVSLNVNIAEHATTTVDVFLPSTLQIPDTDLDYGQQLVVNGEAAPASTITIYIDNSTYATTTTDAQGIWSASLDTAALASGQHSLFVRVVDGFGDQSYPSAARQFSIAAQPGGPPPGSTAPSAPLITFPQADTLWREPTIVIEGTARKVVQVELWDNDTLIGSVWSDQQGAWTIPLQLDQKTYALRARACLDQKCSGFSPVVRLTYEPAGPVSPDERPLQIVVPRSSFTAYQHQTVGLSARVIDGQPPYVARIQWGDGKTETRTFALSDLRFPHAYDKPGKYTVTIDVQDAQGRKNRIHFTVDVRPVGSSTFSLIIKITLIIVLPAITLILFFVFHKRLRKWL